MVMKNNPHPILDFGESRPKVLVVLPLTADGKAGPVLDYSVVNPFDWVVLVQEYL